ncbi:hypothetical protein Gpo141_00007386 [Globisporangium polare]
MADESEQWSCPACTLMNAFLAEACEVCGTTSPLVIESFACEAQGFTSAKQLQAAASSGSGRRSTDGSSPTSSGGGSRSRSSTQDSNGAFAEDIASELDPWVQAEREWAHVEAHQESKPKRK